ncbi:MAG: Mrp/NBP35 family ATP-binding protein [Lachnospiraceae bacterium]|nr:Mrp/NBP35 family ATP-binding protein [Lachnospiraceae bacterium]
MSNGYEESGLHYRSDDPRSQKQDDVPNPELRDRLKAKKKPPVPEKAPLNEMSTVRKVIGVVSGKGGVGKSFTSSMLAVAMQKAGYRCAILDADVTGPSIPKAFGLKEKAMGDDYGILPSVTSTGIQVMSLNLILENETDPVVWRGPVISGTVKQFWSEVVWSDVDYMFVDMPPGTGDVALTVFQDLPIDGIVIVTSPQELVSMIVEKAVNMAGLMKVPILGLVENMSYIECPDCGKRIEVFGKSHVDEIAEKYMIPVLARVPISQEIATLSDEGKIEQFDAKYFEEAVKVLK